MADILHRVTLDATPEQLFQALSQREGLSAWWTRAESADEENKSINFHFGPEGDYVVTMQIVESTANKQVTWRCTNGPWVETGEFSFQIQPDERGCVLLFAHHGWPQANEFYMHCNAKWGFFLVVSLKQYLETGTGQPHPADPDI